MRRRRLVTFVLVLVLIGGGVLVVGHLRRSPSLTPLRARIVAVAQGQVGYQTDPSDTYCNKFSAYWYAGVDDCGNDNLDEEWCADFAAWVWQQAGAEVQYKLSPGYLNGNSASFYVWGTDHGTWHPVGSGYTPQPGDVAVYGLDTSAVTAVHVAIVTAATGDNRAPDVINGDGDKTGYSVVEVGDNQGFADAKQKGSPLSGYVSPSSATAATAPAPAGSSGSSSGGGGG
jgi:hypothetical protein